MTAKIEIFTAPRCGYCDNAKAVLEDLELPFEEFDVSEDQHRQEFTRRLPRVRSVPQIFINGDHVGGFEDLTAMLVDGRLDKLQEQAG